MTTKNKRPSDKILYYYGEINDTNVGQFIQNFINADQTPGDINIVMYSPGGDPDLAMSMYDIIKGSKNQVIMIGSGLVGSAAVLPFLAADVRLMQTNCRLFLHEIQVSSPHETTWNKTKVNRINRSANDQFHRYCEMVAEDTGTKLEEIINLCSEDTYLDLKKASMLGFIDGELAHSEKKVKSNTSFSKVASKLPKVKGGKN